MRAFSKNEEAISMPRCLFIFLTLAATGCLKSQIASQPDFASGEHLLLGERAITQVCQEEDLPCDGRTEFPREDGEEKFTYGELIAFAGDFYESPEALWTERHKISRIGEDPIGNNKKIFRKEIIAIGQMEAGIETEYPVSDVAFMTNFHNYSSLALKNDHHFGFNNVVSYVTHHAEALKIAAEAFELNKTQPANAEKMWNKALFYNSYADHLVSDAFAAGHIRVPRTQIRQWAQKNGHNDRLAGTLSKILHDNDGKLAAPDGKGLMVKNARGDEWDTRGDGELFWSHDGNHYAVNQAVEAVRLSLKELVTAYKTGKTPDGIYAALEVAPYPVPDKNPQLASLFGNPLRQERVKELVKESGWYSKIPFLVGLNEENLESFLKDLPVIMEDFRKDIAKTSTDDPNLHKRVPQAYLQGFTVIQ